MPLALLLILAAGCGATCSSTADRDRKLAAAVVLTAEDLPGYVEAEPGSEGGGLKADTCNGPNRTWDEKPRQRGASGDDFRKDDDSVRVQSAAVVARTSPRRGRRWPTSAAPCPASACGENDRARLAGDEVTVLRFSIAPLPDLAVGEETVGVRTTARVSSGDRPSTLVFDLTYVRVGRFQTPFSADERAPLATIMAGRMPE